MSYLPNPFGVISTINSNTTPISASTSWSGSWEDVSDYASISTIATASNAGTLYAEFSTDGINTDRTIPLSDGTSGDMGIHSLTPIAKYFRVKLTNGGSNQTGLRLQTIYNSGGRIALPTSRISQTLNSYTDVLNVRSSLFGTTDGGDIISVPVTPEGHIEVAIHAPRNPFGSIHTENLTPIFQSDAVYGINSGQVFPTQSFSGTASVDDSAFVCNTGTTIYSQASIQSRKRLRYRPGQGIVGRFAGYFTTGVDNSYQVLGFGHAEDGVYFAYSGSSFGILYSNRGVREIQTLNITTPSSTTETAQVVLNSVSNSVSITNSGNVLRTAYEISNGTYNGWKAYPVSSSVVFVADSVGNKAGTFNIIATSAVGTFTETRAGSATTESFISQSSWNGDTMDGTGRSGVTLDPTKGNVYQMGIQYLGFGTLTFSIESSPEDGNNADFITVHTIKLPNTLTRTSFGNPSFPFTMAAYSAGSTSNLSVKVGSFAGFIEGNKKLHGNRFSYENTIATAGPTNYQALFTVMNGRTYNGKSNQAVINILDVSCALKHNQPASFYLIKNGTLGGNPNFASYANNSCALRDTSATTVTFSTNDQLVWVGQLADTSNLEKEFSLDEEITLQPGEWITLACKTSGATATYAAGSINTREDQ
jgi:hypothetical protein